MTLVLSRSISSQPLGMGEVIEAAKDAHQVLAKKTAIQPGRPAFGLDGYDSIFPRENQC